MIIEWLKFRVEAKSREEFIARDQKIWTSFLSSVPGFLGKEVWIEPSTPNHVIFIIRWRTREDWQSISDKELKQVNRRFSTEMRRLNIHFKSISGAEYQVRKFS